MTVMKKVLFFLLVSAIVITSQAQLGLTAGGNICKWRGNNFTETSGFTGYNFGAYGNVKLNSKLSIQSEVTFSQEGAKDRFMLYTVKLDYLNLTELLRYNEKCGFYAGTGPQLGLYLYGQGTQYGVSKYIKDEFKLSNFSWAFATGYDMKIGIGIYARYNVGFANIAAKRGETIMEDIFQAGLRYNFKTKLK